MTHEQAQAIVQKYVNAWNQVSGRPSMWVLCASPGQTLAIPGVTFGASEQLCAGMELPLNAHLIVLHSAMTPESTLRTFLHEYGHAIYRIDHSQHFDPIDSEVAAIRHSLLALDNEGLTSLAREEVTAIISMGSFEPYASAIQRLTMDDLWRTYSEGRV